LGLNYVDSERVDGSKDFAGGLGPSKKMKGLELLYETARISGDIGKNFPRERGSW